MFSKTNVDRTQEASLSEKCFLVDENDQVIGEATKRDCHLVQQNGDIKLHRAFSVFLFNSKGELLIQKRASTKITYPNTYSNTCCSHPLSEIPIEREEYEALGVKRAAQRRLTYELGIPKEDLFIENFTYLTRIHYKDKGDGKYGEHEIDYIIFIQQDVCVKPNSNEVSEVVYLRKEDCNEFIQKNKTQLTPWFNLILKYHLKIWWNNLSNLDKFKNHETILRLKF